MTNRPRLKLGVHMVPGLIAVALFALLAVVFLDAGFTGGEGFDAALSITAGIGYAMFNLGGEIPSEGFLVAFIVIALVLDAALEGSVMLARRDDESLTESLRADGGRRTDADAGTADGADADDADGGDAE